MTDAPAEPEGEFVVIATGVCPSCPGSPVDECSACRGTGIVSFPKTFTEEDDRYIIDSILEGRSPTWVAQTLKPVRSVSAVAARVAALGIRPRAPEPSSIRIVSFTGESVDIHDPAKSPRWAP